MCQAVRFYGQILQPFPGIKCPFVSLNFDQKITCTNIYNSSQECILYISVLKLHLGGIILGLG